MQLYGLCNYASIYYNISAEINLGNQRRLLLQLPQSTIALILYLKCILLNTHTLPLAKKVTTSDNDFQIYDSTCPAALCHMKIHKLADLSAAQRGNACNYFCCTISPCLWTGWEGRAQKDGIEKKYIFSFQWNNTKRAQKNCLLCQLYHLKPLSPSPL